MQIINLNIDLEQDLEITLNETAYVFRFQWLESLGRWSFNILDAELNPLLMGRILVPGRRLNNRLAARLPGALVALRQDGTLKPIGREEINTEVLFVYVSEEEDQAILDSLDDGGLIGKLTFEFLP